MCVDAYVCCIEIGVHVTHTQVYFKNFAPAVETVIPLVCRADGWAGSARKIRGYVRVLTAKSVYSRALSALVKLVVLSWKT